MVLIVCLIVQWETQIKATKNINKIIDKKDYRTKVYIIINSTLFLEWRKISVIQILWWKKNCDEEERIYEEEEI